MHKSYTNKMKIVDLVALKSLHSLLCVQYMRGPYRICVRIYKAWPEECLKGFMLFQLFEQYNTLGIVYEGKKNIHKFFLHEKSFMIGIYPFYLYLAAVSIWSSLFIVYGQLDDVFSQASEPIPASNGNVNCKYNTSVGHTQVDHLVYSVSILFICESCE